MLSENGDVIKTRQTTRPLACVAGARKGKGEKKSRAGARRDAGRRWRAGY